MLVQDSTSRFATTDEAARLLRISRVTVRRMIHRHEIPAVRIGRQYRVDLDALDRNLVMRRER